MAMPQQAETATDFVRVQARVRPDETALWSEGRETSFATLDAFAFVIRLGQVKIGEKGCWPNRTWNAAIWTAS